MNDTTEIGSISHTRRELWRYTWPAMISGLSVPLLGLVDTAIVGRVDSPLAIGAVALGSWLFDLLYWSFGFIRMGTTGLVSQARGRGEHAALRALLVRPLIIAVIVGLLVSVLAYIYAPFALSHLAGGVSDEGSSREQMTLIEVSISYVHARIYGGPAVLVNYALLGWLLGMGAAKRALALQLTLNLLNLSLSLWWGLGFGVVGIGLASAASQWITALLWGYLVWCHLCPQIPWKELKTALSDRQEWTALYSMNLDLWLRTCLLLGSFGLINAVSARLGALTLSANALLLHLQSLQSFALDGFAHGAEVIVGERLGAQDRLGYRQALRVGIEWTMITSLAISLLYLCFAPWGLSLMTTHQEVINEVLVYLPWAVLSPIVSAPCFLLDGVMIGAVKSRAMRDSMIISALSLISCLFFFVPTLQNHGLWLAFLTFMIVRAGTLLPTAIKLAK